MHTLTAFMIFVFILFLYLHIIAQYKKSEDLEIYEADYVSNTHLQEICDIRQPVLFDLRAISSTFLEEHKLDWQHIEEFAKKSDLDVHVKDVSDIRTLGSEYAGESVPLPLSSAIGLMETDPKSRFFSENNQEFVNDVLGTRLSSMDEFIRPNFTVLNRPDLMFGSPGAYTPLRYHTDFRRYVWIASGKIQIKMTPWKSRHLLHLEHDYVNYEFRSPIDVWNPQETFSKEMENLNFLEFDVPAGFLLYVPPYWFYSIKYGKKTSDSDSGLTQVYAWTHNTLMNITANVPMLAMYYLQQWNTEKKLLKKMNLTETAEADPAAEDSTDSFLSPGGEK
jgi:hypothetical protein